MIDPADRRPRFGAAARVVEAAPARRRILALAIALAIGAAALGARAAQLALMAPAPTWSAEAAAERPARRDIVDRNGVLLAGAVRTWTLVGLPQQAWRPSETAAALTRVFPDLDAAATLRRLTATDREAVYLRHGLSERQRRAVLALGEAGLAFEAAPERIYPHADLAAHTLGGVNRDHRGVAGLERAWEAEILRDATAPVRASLDVRLQHALEAELDAARAAAKAKGAAGVLLDGRTGEILALASRPAFDLNAQPEGNDPRRRNLALAPLEPGSVVKPLLVAAALDHGLTRAAERFAPEPLALAGFTVRDPHPAPGPMTLTEALARSSNVAAARLALRLGHDPLLAAYGGFGLLAPLGPTLPDAPAPPAPAGAGEAATATLGYGYGFETSLLALAQAYAAFCNEGAWPAATFAAAAQGEAPPPLRRAMSAEAAAATLGMLRAVVREGTGRRAGAVSIAGKTGTAEKIAPGGGYDPERVRASFAGVFPAQAPRYVVAVMVDEPAATGEDGGAATGGAIAAPAAARVVARSAPLLGVAPGSNVAGQGDQS